MVWLSLTIYKHLVLNRVIKTERSVTTLLYALVVVTLFVKVISPESKYIDLVVSPSIVAFSLMAVGFFERNQQALLIGVLYLVAFGFLNESKAAALRVVYAVLFFYFVYGFRPKFKNLLYILFAFSGGVILTLQIVWYRANGEFFSTNDLSIVAPFALDIITARFIFVDGLYIAEKSSDISIAFLSFVNNMFVYLPGVSVSDRTIGNIIACDIDRNCLGEHAGALGLPALFILVDNIWLLLGMFFLLLSLFFYLFSYFNRYISVYFLTGLNIYIVIALINIFISGNLDLIFSEIIVVLIGLTAINWMSRVSFGGRRYASNVCTL